MENDNINILDNNYIIIIRLYLGSLYKVFLVTNINDNKQYVAKVRKDNLHFQNNDYLNEIQMTNLASGLNNPHIIHFVRHGSGDLVENGVATHNVNYMILEYCSKGDLFDYINLGGLAERQAKYFFKKILLGVQALHVAGLCHRNLKLDSILLDHNFCPKINDFSFTTRFQQNNHPILLNDAIGAKLYACPQILSHQPYNGEKADIFILGVMLFTLVSGRFGFASATKYDKLYRRIMIQNFQLYWNDLAHDVDNIHFSDLFKDLYIRMVSVNENNRPNNIAQVLQDQWFDEINNLNNDQLNQLEMEVGNEFSNRENILKENNAKIVNKDDYNSDDSVGSR